MLGMLGEDRAEPEPCIGIVLGMLMMTDGAKDPKPVGVLNALARPG